MKNKILLSIAIIGIFSIACKQKISAIVEKEFKIPNFSSGSGMAKINNVFYACGDDDARLWFLDNEGKVLNTWQIWDSTDIENNRISKKVKPDFEAITNITIQNDSALLIFGSGTKAVKREYIIEAHITPNQFAYRKNAQKLYEWIKKQANLGEDELNIEGACSLYEDILITNRHNNQMYQINKKGLLNYLENNDLSLLSMKISHFKLPVVGKDTARLSGATRIPNTNIICFSASIESTENWVDDGKILGSFVGLINWDTKEYFSTKLELKNKADFKGKLEAIEFNGFKNNSLNLIGITDDDNGTTSFLKIQLVNIPTKWHIQ